MENNKENPTTVPETDVAETTDETTEVTDTSEEETETEDSSSTIDYEAELEAEKKRGPDPEKAKEAFKQRSEKRVEETLETEENDEDKPLSRKEAQELFRIQTQAFQKEQQSERIAEIAKDISESEGEANLIVEIHKNRVFPEGMPLREQLEESWAIANRKRLIAKTVELGRTVKSKDTASKDAASTHHDPQKGTEPKLSAGDAASLKRAGYSYNATSKRYEKKLPNGKILAKEPGKPPYIAS